MTAIKATENHEPCLFSELYTCYYQVVARILTKAARHPLSRRQIEDLAKEHGYDESALLLVPRLIRGDWPFLEKVSPDTYASRLKYPPFPSTHPAAEILAEGPAF